MERPPDPRSGSDPLPRPAAGHGAGHGTGYGTGYGAGSRAHDRSPRHRPAPSAQIGLWVVLVWMATGALGALLAGRLWDRFGAGTEAREMAVLRQVRTLVERSYVREPAERELLDGALRGMIDDLDPYSRYVPPRETAQLEQETSGVFVGIGVVFAQTGETYRVLYPLPGGPAEAAGVRVGERILRLDGERADEPGLGTLRDRLQGAAGRQVELELEDLEGTRRTLALRPEPVVDPTVRHARLLPGGDGIGYLAISSFSRRTPEEFDRAVAALRERGMSSLVLDLRGNLGGVLESATRIANRFVAEGLIVRSESRAGHEDWRAEKAHAGLLGMPLVVLIDRDSASASEVLAGALQDHRAAVLVGERSYGKGTVQTLLRVRGTGGVVKLSTALYRTPSGRLIERNLPGAWDAGLVPDVEIELPIAEHRALRQFLSGYGAPLAHQEAIRAWEAERGVELLTAPPPDAHLDAALELFAGRRPAEGSG